MSIQTQNERGGVIASLFVRRPVLAVVVNALIIVAGLAAFFGVEVRELPSVERPTVSVNTSFTGASAETVDREITAEIEGVVARVQGVSSISSSSSYGQSRVSLSFADGTNLDNATSDIRDALSRITNRLPDGVEAGLPPLPFAQAPRLGAPYAPTTPEPAADDPGTTDSDTTDPATTDPAAADPTTTDPATTDPATADPATTTPAG